MNLLVIDLETTGTDPLIHRITQIAARHEKDRKILAQFNQKIGHSDIKVDLGALRVNKTALSALPSFGSDEKAVITAFVDFLLSIKEDRDDPLVILGHNVGSFDVQFLKAALARNNISGFDNAVAYRTEDTATVGSFLRRANLIDVKKFSLGNLAKALDIKVDEKQTHDAMYDVDLTSQVYYAMLDLMDRMKQTNVLNMHEVVNTDEKPTFKAQQAVNS